MTEYIVKRPLRLALAHPGELMREILTEQLRIPIARAARLMRTSRPSLYAVLNGTGSVTADMALRFARLVGGRPELLFHMQEARDLWYAERRLAKVLAKIEPVEQAA